VTGWMAVDNNDDPGNRHVRKHTCIFFPINHDDYVRSIT
jgi:hypothetical protein